jgi:predicted  nucleic acid-binding Zn-ribbon protein
MFVTASAWSKAKMMFVCMLCGKTTADIDEVLDGACSCGCTHFHLVSEDRSELPVDLNQKEAIRRDLHRWLDLNLDSMPPEVVGNIRVLFEIEKDNKPS